MRTITHNYIIEYLIFYIESKFCDRITELNYIEISKITTTPICFILQFKKTSFKMLLFYEGFLQKTGV
ncbi:hypothetical protein APS47_19010 [Leptospira kirschneri serovar Mozdok]|nr:hypothetical protein APS47_19010 [Leptospira kirschneri serovar Mozdok]